MKDNPNNSEDLSPPLAKIILLTTLLAQITIVLIVYWFYLKEQDGLAILIAALALTLVIWQWIKYCQKLFKRVNCKQCQSFVFNRVSQLFQCGIYCVNCHKKH